MVAAPARRRAGAVHGDELAICAGLPSGPDPGGRPRRQARRERQLRQRHRRCRGTTADEDAPQIAQDRRSTCGVTGRIDRARSRSVGLRPELFPDDPSPLSTSSLRQYAANSSGAPATGSRPERRAYCSRTSVVARIRPTSSRIRWTTATGVPRGAQETVPGADVEAGETPALGNGRQIGHRGHPSCGGHRQAPAPCP
jgi:hypothetical protein